MTTVCEENLPRYGEEEKEVFFDKSSAHWLLPLAKCALRSNRPTTVGTPASFIVTVLVTGKMDTGKGIDRKRRLLLQDKQEAPKRYGIIYSA